MGGLNLISLAAHTGWVFSKTLLLHFVDNKSIKEQSVARSKDMTFDTAFHIVKTFLRQSSEGSVEDLQAFCNIFIPSPSWITVVTVKIPPEMADQAAEILLEHIGEETMDTLIGGRTWWRKRARADGCIEGEWISMKRDWNGNDLKEKLKEKSKTSFASESATKEAANHHGEDQYEQSLDEQRCIFYVHGGGYYFGSLNTHRYSIWRMARKAGARAFAVSYRLSPQYPFPCALQDCLAAYLYLIRPPAGAPHKPVDPARLVFAGDSAGGAICLSLLCMLRDMGLPLPSGAALISPWTDLCESFPSIMTNVDTDVIPPYGFIHKPSTLWPPLPAEDRQRVDTFFKQSRADRAADAIHRRATHAAREADREKKAGTMSTRFPEESQDKGDNITSNHAAGPADLGSKAEPDSPIYLDIDGQKVEFRDQLHMYATNVQLSHPLVSPALQPSLGGLPPLYIMCGDKEMLRDEIVYTAHRAANPEKYPLRESLIKMHGNEKRAELAKDYAPTNVHLQIYDGMCHDLPLFSFIPPARYCYRAIASFCVAVTSPEINLLSPNNSAHARDATFAGLRTPASSTSLRSHRNETVLPEMQQLVQEPQPISESNSTLGDFPNLKAKPELALQIPNRKTSTSVEDSLSPNASSAYPGSQKKWSKNKLDELKETMYSAAAPYNRPDFQDHMIRERISVRGRRRDVEPASEIKALQLDPENIGLLHEEPVKRYLQGRKKWDRKFAHTTKRVRKERRKQVEAAANLERERRARREKGKSEDEDDDAEPTSLWHLPGENPPPSSIAARKDTKEALRLASIGSETRWSATHPLKLWIELQNFDWLKRAAAHEMGTTDVDESDEDANSEDMNR